MEPSQTKPAVADQISLSQEASGETKDSRVDESTEATENTTSPFALLPAELIVIIFDIVAEIDTWAHYQCARLSAHFQLLMAPLGLDRRLRAILERSPSFWRCLARNPSLASIDPLGYDRLLTRCDSSSLHTLDTLILNSIAAKPIVCWSTMYRWVEIIRKSKVPLKKLVWEFGDLPLCFDEATERFMPLQGDCDCKQCSEQAQRLEAPTTATNQLDDPRPLRTHALRYTFELLYESPALETLALHVIEFLEDSQLSKLAQKSAARPKRMLIEAHERIRVDEADLAFCKSSASRVELLSMKSSYMHCGNSQRGSPDLYDTVLLSAASTLRSLDLRLTGTILDTLTFRRTSFPLLETIFVNHGSLSRTDSPSTYMYRDDLPRAQMPLLSSLRGPAAFVSLIQAPSLRKVGLTLANGRDTAAAERGLQEWFELETLALYMSSHYKGNFEKRGSLIAPILKRLCLNEEGDGYLLLCPRLTELGIYHSQPTWFSWSTLDLDTDNLPRDCWRDYHDDYQPHVFEPPGQPHIDWSLLGVQRQRMSEAEQDKDGICKALKEIRVVGFPFEEVVWKQLVESDPSIELFVCPTPVEEVEVDGRLEWRMMAKDAGRLARGNPPLEG